MATFATDEDILKAAEDWRKQGRGVALATVVETWGSAPRPVGSNLVIDSEGNFLGSVSGGCVEGAVVTEAMDVIASGKPKMLEFGVADETAWKLRLPRGETMRGYGEKVTWREARRAAHVKCGTVCPSCRGACHRCGQWRTAAGQSLRRIKKSSEGGVGQAVAHGQKRDGGHTARARFSDRLCAFASPRHHRRGTYQPDAGADRPTAWLRRHHCRSAHGLCLD